MSRSFHEDLADQTVRAPRSLPTKAGASSHSLLRLQRTAGNEAVLQLLESHASLRVQRAGSDSTSSSEEEESEEERSETESDDEGYEADQADDLTNEAEGDSPADLSLASDGASSEGSSSPPAKRKKNTGDAPNQQASASSVVINERRENYSRKDVRDALKRAADRNQKHKARPAHPRATYETQKNVNYSPLEESKDIDFAQHSVLGNIRKGRASQPLLSANKNQYEGATVPSDYDALSKVLDATDPQAAATDMLDAIQRETKLASQQPKERRAEATMIQLIEFVEPHQSRIPGSDKFGRACLRYIAAGGADFRELFNRESGVFAPAHAKKQSGHTGQDAGRTQFSKEHLSNDTTEAIAQDIFERARKVVEYMSDSSEDEGPSGASSSSSTSTTGATTEEESDEEGG